MKPKVTIYTPSRNYGRFLIQCIESVVAQSFKDWELIIVIDGATDESAIIAERYLNRFPDQIRIIDNPSAQGLQSCANSALNAARGEYIMRLDADDYLDESALLVMVEYLDRRPEVALVYPNYIYVTEEGKFLALEERKRIGQEAKLLDLPAHGACTLIRKRILKAVGGYSELYDVQDGYDLWLKILHRYPVGNISTPLFFYRQHQKSQSKNEEKILEIRGRIKRERVEAMTGPVKPSIVAVIGAKNTYPHLPNIVFQKIAGKHLIDYTLESSIVLGIFDKIVVTTDDPKVQEYCSGFSNVIPIMRSMELSNDRITTTEVVHDATLHLEKDFNIFPDIIVYLNCHAPLRQASHIQQAIDTLLLYNTDVVVGVYEDLNLHYVHGENGLKPLSKVRHEQLRIEREALYVNNAALRVSWRDTLTKSETSGLKVGHITMTRNESFHIRNQWDVWLIDQMMKNKKGEPALVKDPTELEVE